MDIRSCIGDQFSGNFSPYMDILSNIYPSKEERLLLEIIDFFYQVKNKR